MKKNKAAKKTGSFFSLGRKVGVVILNQLAKEAGMRKNGIEVNT